MPRLLKTFAFAAALLAVSMAAGSPARAQFDATSMPFRFDATSMSGGARARAEFEATLKPTYLECPDARSPALVFSADNPGGLSVQMKVLAGWMHLGVRRPGTDSYSQLWSEISKIDGIAPKHRPRLQRAIKDYEDLLGVCRGPEEPRAAYFRKLQNNRQAVSPRWLGLGHPWPLELTERMKTIPPAEE